MLSAVIARDAVPDEDILLALQAAEAGSVLLHPTSVRGLIQESCVCGRQYNTAEELHEELTAP